MKILSRKTKLKLQSFFIREKTRVISRLKSRTSLFFWLLFLAYILFVNYGPKDQIQSAPYIFIVLTILFMAFNLRKTENANMTISTQKEKLAKQNGLILKQKKLVEEKIREVQESITYAKRLQDAILPPIALIQKHLPQSFVLYQPKDIVAGDFYWMQKTAHPSIPSLSDREGESHENDKGAGNIILIAACDCTGHGVPGALVSVVCSNALNRTVNEFKITEPGKILDKTRELVLETFSHRDAFGEKSESDIKDGMDISLCSIDTQNNLLQWSGAYNPLWYVFKGEMKEVIANKQPIGKTDKPLPFTTHTLNLNKGDTLYLFTDGYADQFGGPKGKKLKYKPFKDILLANSALPMPEQHQRLQTAFNEWKGNLEQVDDVLIIGIKV